MTTPGAGGRIGPGRALAGLTGERPDVADVLALLVADCAETCGARAVVVLARAEPDADLELLTASSHRPSEMEVWQAQRGSGPCVEAMDASRPVHRTAAAAGVGKGALGTLMADAGFVAVSAYPVAWRGSVLAGLNLFWADERTETPGGGSEPARVYADLVALAIAHPALTEATAVRAQLRHSLAERAVVEQAKGVLAWTEHLDMGEAYERLLALTASSSSTLTELASEVVLRRGAPGGPD